MLHQIQCQYPACGATFTAARRTAKYCPLHKHAKNSARDLRRLEDHAPAEAAAARAALAAPAGMDRALVPLRIACALGLTPDVDLALASAGVDANDPGAAELVLEARRRFPEVAAGDPLAFQNIQRLGAAQAAISIIAAAFALPPDRAATALKSGMQALELAQQGAGKVFTQTIVNLKITPV